ncbi:MAG: hypothetical protein KJN97_09085 [Deltaproteobacteria bacterium]|nr:hypothetical protein [Deltaproteobacteria bacterium]
MGKTWGSVLNWAFLTIFVVGFVGPIPAAAQEGADDAAAREYFKAGRAAYNQADYESALTYFRHAYRASGRGVLQYNIGLAADRLRRDREALEAFERYLEEAETLVREAEVRQRIDTLRKSIAEKEAAERELEAARLRLEEAAKASSRERGNSREDRRGNAKPKEAEMDARPVSTPAELPASASRPAGVAFQMPEYAAAADEPVAKKKKWPWIVAAAAVVVAGGVTAGVILSQRTNESPPAGSGLAVSW